MVAIVLLRSEGERILLPSQVHVSGVWASASVAACAAAN